MRRPAGTVLAALAAAGMARAADAPGAGGWTLDALMAELGQVRSASAHFTELKTVHILTRPIETEGTLKYIAPDKLEKTTTAPAPETILLDGGMLTGTRADGETFSIDLESHSEIAALVEAIRATLAGDEPELRHYYSIGFSGDQDRWTMDLAPKDRRVREKVEHILIQGSGNAVHMIAVFETDGDHSEMTITPDHHAP